MLQPWRHQYVLEIWRAGGKKPWWELRTGSRVHQRNARATGSWKPGVGGPMGGSFVRHVRYADQDVGVSGVEMGGVARVPVKRLRGSPRDI